METTSGLSGLFGLFRHLVGLVPPVRRTPESFGTDCADDTDAFCPAGFGSPNRHCDSSGRGQGSKFKVTRLRGIQNSKFQVQSSTVF